jgi:tRNA-specific 2-thiouridylase
MLAETPFATHLERPAARGHTPEGAFTGAAGGAACGDLIRVSLALDPASPDGAVRDAGFDASGCGATIAAGSAAVALVHGAPLLDAARVGAREIAAALGGLIPAKRHAAELAADALHRALGAAARAWAGRPLAAPADGRSRTLVAMSGGVDSAVAALLCARAGEHVVGVTLELWADPENDASRSCCSADAVRGARALAHDQGMPHLSLDLRAEFRAGVVDPWLAGHAAGHTPNPCLRCNGTVRLDAMLDVATRLGAGTLVTGHYARVHRGPLFGEESAPRAEGARRPERAATDRDSDEDGRPLRVVPDRSPDEDTPLLRRAPDRRPDEDTPLLRRARDPVKDQSYVLAGLDLDSLARLRFPLGGMLKDEVREIAADAGLQVARKPDSQDLCFLAGTRLPRFLERHGASTEAGPGGEILDRAGRRLGSHRGARAYTVGQRHGLGLGGGAPLYVLGTDAVANTVTVGPREALRTDTVAIRDVTLRRPGARVDGVKIRSRGARHACRLTGALQPGSHARAELRLREPIERTAPGQVACLYAGDVILGYGTIAA